MCRFRKVFKRGIDGLRADIELLKTVLEKIGSPVVFCHNDLLLTNIILQRDTAAGDRPINVAFIDYEYAMPNYQAFDIANHFIEFAGMYVVFVEKTIVKDVKKLFDHLNFNLVFIYTMYQIFTTRKQMPYIYRFL